MKVVALVSGGKDSCFSIVKAQQHGHEIVCLANLCPQDNDVQELDSFCFQTVGHNAVQAIAQAMEIPLIRRRFSGNAVVKNLHYTTGVNEFVTCGQASSSTVNEDEVEDLYALLHDVKRMFPQVEAVTSGAILSNYQRLRVESVCTRLKLISLAYMWQRNQSSLLNDMIQHNLNAILIKVASHGLDPHEHLGKSLHELSDHFQALERKFGFQSCGEGGEYETFTLDCTSFKHRIVIDKSHIVVTDKRSNVGHLIIDEYHLERKTSAMPKVVTGQIARASNSDSPPYSLSISTTMPDSIISSNSSNALAFAATKVETQGYDTTKDTESHVRAPLYPPFCSGDKHFYVSSCLGLFANGIDDKIDTDESVTLEEEARVMMATMLACVNKHGASPSDILFVNLYLVDMSKFVEVNKVYRKSFGYNPPSRACIQVSSLPMGAQCMAECMGYTDSGLSIGDVRCEIPRDVLHVQSISEWAPTCIGPYSQANTLGMLHFQAGQIGLVPASMTLVDSLGGTPGSCLIDEASQATKNCEAVLRCCNSSPSCVVSCIVFVNVCNAIADSFPKLEQMLSAWLKSSEGQNDATEEELSKRNKNIDRVISFVIVPNLPRGAAVEILLISTKTELVACLGAPKSQCFISDSEGSLPVVAKATYILGCFCIGTSEVSGAEGEKIDDAFDSYFEHAIDALTSCLDEAAMEWSHVLQMQIFIRNDYVETICESKIVSCKRVLAKRCHTETSIPAVSLICVEGFGDDLRGSTTRNHSMHSQVTVMQIQFRAYRTSLLQKKVKKIIIETQRNMLSNLRHEVEEEEELIVVDDLELLRENELAKIAALSGVEGQAPGQCNDDASDVASECSDMSDVSDIFPSIIGAVDDEDEDNEDEGEDI